MAAAPTNDPLRAAALKAQADELARVQKLTDPALVLELIEALIVHLGSPPTLTRYLEEAKRRAAPTSAPAPAPPA